MGLATVQDHLARITQDTQAQDHLWVTLGVTQDTPSLGSSQEGALLVERGACGATTCGEGWAGTWGGGQGASQAGPGSRNTVFSRKIEDSLRETLSLSVSRSKSFLSHSE